jgi:hypothetical protein
LPAEKVIEAQGRGELHVVDSSLQLGAEAQHLRQQLVGEPALEFLVFGATVAIRSKPLRT